MVLCAITILHNRLFTCIVSGKKADYERANPRTDHINGNLMWVRADPTANVPLSYAKLDTGYLNSGIYDLGWFLCGIGRKGL
jgi:hypothetical protein